MTGRPVESIGEQIHLAVTTAATVLIHLLLYVLSELLSDGQVTGDHERVRTNITRIKDPLVVCFSRTAVANLPKTHNQVFLL